LTRFSEFELIANPSAEAHCMTIESAKYYIKNDLAAGLNPIAQYTITCIIKGNTTSNGISKSILLR
jgi:hypothetical protein